MTVTIVIISGLAFAAHELKTPAVYATPPVLEHRVEKLPDYYHPHGPEPAPPGEQLREPWALSYVSTAASTTNPAVA
jgi:hypothetical protein